MSCFRLELSVTGIFAFRFRFSEGREEIDRSLAACERPELVSSSFAHMSFLCDGEAVFAGFAEFAHAQRLPTTSFDWRLD